MAGPTISAQEGAALGGVAADAHSLDQLRQLANRDPAKAVKAVATQFEALFMQMVLKSMRDATPKSGLLDSSEQQTYTSMLDEQLAQKIAAGGTGLSAVIERQLSRNLPHPAVPAATGTATSAASSAASAAATSTAPATPAPPAAAGPSRRSAALVQTLRAAAALRGGK